LPAARFIKRFVGKLGEVSADGAALLRAQRPDDATEVL
jgi:hypothetical protein